MYPSTASTESSNAPFQFSEAERARTFERFQLLRPFLEEGVPLARVARDHGLALRTARRWVGQYRREGLAGLARKGRSDRGKRHLSATLRQGIEGLALRKPRLSAASIHRQAVAIAERLGKSPPSCNTVYALIRELDPALLTPAHEGMKAYADTFELIHRHEATGPNAVWQADHTELDIWLPPMPPTEPSKPPQPPRPGGEYKPPTQVKQPIKSIKSKRYEEVRLQIRYIQGMAEPPYPPIPMGIWYVLWQALQFSAPGAQT